MIALALANIFFPKGFFFQYYSFYLKGPETPCKLELLSCRKVKSETFPPFLSKSLDHYVRKFIKIEISKDPSEDPRYSKTP